MRKLESVYDSLEFEGARQLKRYRRRLKRINEIGSHYTDLSLDELRKEARSYLNDFNIKNKKQVEDVFAIAREASKRLLGKFQYDVQVLGALATLERNMIQMSTGSGKTITLILPAVVFGLIHKGVHVLTVNDYLSKRDWEETKVIYDFFGLSSAYVDNNMSPEEQQMGFSCDITYCTNSTLGFAYLNSCLASGIGQDMKRITRPLYAAIIDEVDEVLMDDARNPLIIASPKDLTSDLATVEDNGTVYSVQDIVDKMKHLTQIGKDLEDQSNEQVFISDEMMDEIMDLFGLDETIFQNSKLMHVLYNSFSAQFEQQRYQDYMVMEKPDPDSQSRIVLIDKATGRLAKGRTLSDNLHAFVEMKEHVFAGSGNDSSIQITYQVLFNFYQTIAGVSGTLGTSFEEFIQIYRTGVVVIPDRVPNQLQQKTSLYVTEQHLLQDLVRLTRFYQVARFPVLIGATNDLGVDRISQILASAGIQHKTLKSTDTNEEVIIEKAGLPGSVVVTTDIMGRGTDIHISETDYERGLAVFQVDTRPNTRVERQFAGRAARQGQPGRYHRLLALPDLAAMGLSEAYIGDLNQFIRENKDVVDFYHGDVFLDGGVADYEDLVNEIDEAMKISESVVSNQRVQEFQSQSLTDIIQGDFIHDLDSVRARLKQVVAENDVKGSRKLAYDLYIGKRKKKQVPKKERLAVQKKLKQLDAITINELIFHHLQVLLSEYLPQLRRYSNDALKTIQLGGMTQFPVKPDIHMMVLLQEFITKHEAMKRLSAEAILNAK